MSKSGSIGEDDQEVGIDEVGDERGQPVVVAESDLVVGDRVVLVDDRHHAELEQTTDGAARVQVLLAHAEVERSEENLSGHDAEVRERAVVHAHQPALTDRRHRLQRLRIPRAAIASEAEGRQPCGDRA